MNIEEFDYSVNVLEALLWQYNDASNLQALLADKQAWYQTNQTEFWENWYTNVFNLITANLFGLSVWAYILNLPLFVTQNDQPNDAPIFGFNAYDPAYPTLINTYMNFGNGNFLNESNAPTLTIEEQRFILRLAYYKYVSNGCTFSINQFLNYLFKTSGEPFNTGTGYALDNLNMSMTYLFTIDLSLELQTVLYQYDLLPRPAGVLIIGYVDTSTVFGFGIYNQNFSYSNFIEEVP
jgi:hypothetical protein